MGINPCNFDMQINYYIFILGLFGYGLKRLWAKLVMGRNVYGLILPVARDIHVIYKLTSKFASNTPTV